VRVVAATNLRLRDAAAEGRFRGDLFLRLTAFPIELPPLRSRGDDVIAIAEHLLAASAPGDPRPSLTEAARRALRRYAWPGNVRELQNCMLAAALAAGSSPIAPEHLPARVRENAPPPSLDVEAYPLTLQTVERAHIERVLGEAGGNRSAAARKLGMNRVTLYRKLKRYGFY